jgi:3',5'-cyclic-AMP phosphodiesterase
MVRLLLVLMLGLVSCKKYIQFSPNEVRLDESERNLNQKNIQKLESVAVKDSFKFIVIGDSQRFYDELDDFAAAINQRNDISFVVLNGDITDFGLNKEFKWIASGLKQLKVPYISVIGNHDMLANGSLVYKEMFGPENFSFQFSHCKFICLNSNSREKGFDGSLPNLNWLKSECSNVSNYQNVFVLSHVPPFHEDFDKSLSESFANTLTESQKVRLSIHGHDHTYAVKYPYGQDVEYLVTGSINKRIYTVISVRHGDYEIEKVEY